VGYTGLRGGLAEPATQNRRCMSGSGVDETERDLDAVAGRVFVGLLERSHLIPPDEIAESIAQAAAPLGVTGACIYLADLEQENLRAVLANSVSSSDVLAINSTLAGRAYLTVTIQYAPAGQYGPAGNGFGGWRV
jgi:hypothetical protein